MVNGGYGLGNSSNVYLATRIKPHFLQIEIEIEIEKQRVTFSILFLNKFLISISSYCCDLPDMTYDFSFVNWLC